MADLPEFGAQELGRRLRLARQAAKITQAQAAEVIGTSRPTLVAIEQGIRKVRRHEIQKLAQIYGASANTLLQRRAVHTDIIPSFRQVHGAGDVHALEAIRALNYLVRAEVELENVLGIQRVREYPPVHDVAGNAVSEVAELRAQDLRNWLGLGPGPITDMFSVAEVSLGIRLYQRELSTSSRVVGVYAHDDNVGACILLNASLPMRRRIEAIATQIGYFTSWRFRSNMLTEKNLVRSRAEIYAVAFGRAFAAPRSGFLRSFSRLFEITGRITRRLIVLLANEYNISPKMCVLRLEELGQTKEGTWRRLEERGGISDQHIQDVLGGMSGHLDRAQVEAKQPLSHRVSLMCHAIWKRKLMSEDELAEILLVSRSDLHKLCEQIELEDPGSGRFP